MFQPLLTGWIKGFFTSPSQSQIVEESGRVRLFVRLKIKGWDEPRAPQKAVELISSRQTAVRSSHHSSRNFLFSHAQLRRWGPLESLNGTRLITFCEYFFSGGPRKEFNLASRAHCLFGSGFASATRMNLSGGVGGGVLRRFVVN